MQPKKIMQFLANSTTHISIPFLSLEFTSTRSLKTNSSPKLLSRSSNSLNNLPLWQTKVKKSPVAASYLMQTKIGLLTKPPELCEEGTGGTYFLKNQQNQPVAVFKPSNEEPLCLQNPKRTTSQNNFHFQGFIPGEGAQREIFAYQIDKGFAGVPETRPAEITHWIFTDTYGIPGTPKSTNLKTKAGSIQKFISDIQCSVDDMGYSKFSIQDVQRIAILDMLLVNCDRNGGNILVRKGSNSLVPIDHAFCLPDYRNLTDLQWFEWITWRQVKQPTLPEVISFIDKFDIDDAIKKATELGIRRECIITLKLSHMFLKRALTKNLTLCEIAKLMCTRGDQPSVFSNMVSKLLTETSSSSTIISHFAVELSKF